MLELTGKKTPVTGLESKFSVYHSRAVGLIYGRAGEHEYSDETVNSAPVLTLRGKFEAVVDNRIDEAFSDIRIETHDGRDLHIFVEHAIGSVQRPMSEVQLKAKLIDQSEMVLGRDKSEKAWAVAIMIGSCPDLSSLLGAATSVE